MKLRRRKLFINKKSFFAEVENGDQVAPKDPRKCFGCGEGRGPCSQFVSKFERSRIK